MIDIQKFRALVQASQDATRQNDPLVHARDEELKQFLYEHADELLSTVAAAQAFDA